VPKMMKQLLFFGLVVGPCLAAQDRFAEDLDEASPSEVAPADKTPVVDTSYPTVAGNGNGQVESTLLFAGDVSQYTDAYVNTQVIPAVQLSSGYTSDQLNIALKGVRAAPSTTSRSAGALASGVEITLLYTALIQGFSLQQLQAVAQVIVAQANNPASPLRAALPQLTGALPIILYTASPIPDGDKLSDGALAGIVVASVVVGIGLLVAIYCAVKSDAEAERASKAEQAAVPYGAEADGVPEKPEDAMV